MFTYCYLYVVLLVKSPGGALGLQALSLHSMTYNSCSLRMVHSFSTFRISMSVQNSQCLTCCLFKEKYIFSTLSHLGSSPIYLGLSHLDKCHAPDGMIQTFLFHSYVLSKVYCVQSRLWNTWHLQICWQ